MKRLAVGLLSALSFALPLGGALVLSAIPAAIAPAVASGFQPNPFQLVNMAYEGALVDQGIPGHLQLEQDYTAGRIRPRDLVMAAVQAGDLPESRLQDEGYINAVRSQMRSLMIDNRRGPFSH